MTNIDAQFAIKSLKFISNDYYKYLCQQYDATHLKFDCDPGFDTLFEYYFSSDVLSSESRFSHIYHYLNEFIHFPYVEYHDKLDIKQQIGEQVFERLGRFLVFLGSERTYLKEFLFKRILSLIDSFSAEEILLETYRPTEEDVLEVISPRESLNHPTSNPSVLKYLLLNYESLSTILPIFDDKLEVIEGVDPQITLLQELGIIDFLNENYECVNPKSEDRSLKANPPTFARLLSLVIQTTNFDTYRRTLAYKFDYSGRGRSRKGIERVKNKLSELGVKKMKKSSN